MYALVHVLVTIHVPASKHTEVSHKIWGSQAMYVLCVSIHTTGFMSEEIDSCRDKTKVACRAVVLAH